MYGKASPLGTWSGFAAGQCTVQIYLAEQYWTAAGQRLFDVAINGTLVMQNFDIFQQAGGRYIALIKTFNINAPTGSVQITIPTAEVANASIAGIKITASAGKLVAIAYHQTPSTDSPH